MSKICYVVTSGDYSDYHICAVFDFKPLAEQWIDEPSNESGYCEIEEYPINAAVTSEGFIYDIAMRRDGNVLHCSLCNNPEQRPNEGRVTEKGLLQIQVRGKTAKHAIKIANEKRTFLIANNEYRHKAGGPF